MLSFIVKVLKFLVKVFKFLVKVFKFLVKHRFGIAFVTLFTLLNYSCFYVLAYVSFQAMTEENISIFELLITTAPACFFASMQYHLFYTLVCEYYNDKARRLKKLSKA